MSSQIVERRCAVAQFVGDIENPIVHAILKQDHIVASFQEHRSETTIILPLPRHIETAVDIDQDGVFPNIGRSIVNVEDLGSCSILDIGHVQFFLDGIRIRGFCLDLIRSRHHHLQHRFSYLDAAAGEAEKKG